MGKLKKSSFLEGTFIATACIFMSKILGIIYVIPFKEIIGDQGGALYGYAYNIYNVFLTVSSVGIPFAICKLTSQYSALGETDKKIRMYRISTVIMMFFSAASFLTCFLFAEPLANLIIGDISGGNTMEDVVFVVRCVSFTLLIVPLLSIKRGYLQGHKYISQPSLSQVVEQFARIIIILVGSFVFAKIFGNVRNAVGISVMAAGIGGLIAFLYLTFVVRKSREELGLGHRVSHTREQDKQIIKDIVVCAVPFIIINLANTLYTSTDMVLVLRFLPRLGFSGSDTELISSIMTTWGTKYNAIITAVSTGLIVSLIPHIVSDHTKGNHIQVNENFNKCLKMILLIITPLSCFISLMANSFWTVFYGTSNYGPKIIRFTILVTIFDCLYMVLNSLMQSLNKKGIVYYSVILGLLLNLGLDVPFMYLFKQLGLDAYYGAIFATFCGFILSNSISLIYLRKNMKLNYKETLRIIPRVVFSLIILIAMGVLFNIVLPIESGSRLVQIFNIAISGIFCGGVYFVINFKALKTVLPEKLIKKLHLG
jgi:O-antigen/teichoic acid export membrane protein